MAVILPVRLSTVNWRITFHRRRLRVCEIADLPGTLIACRGPSRRVRPSRKQRRTSP